PTAHDIRRIHFYLRVSDPALFFSQAVIFEEGKEMRADCAAGGTPGCGPER
ncbi:MAG: hypothetical protein Q9211_006455, partial [Gyalolechia sp. 1 TL-2023]